MCALVSPVASVATFARSAAVSLPPSARLTTKIDVALAFCGNWLSASFCACADSEELGRKLVSSEVETLESDGAIATRTTTATSQTPITRQG